MKYVLSDMDGTLLNEQKEFSPCLYTVIELLKEKGVCFGIGSGRQYYNLKKRFAKQAKDMLFICENGSMVFHGDTPLYVDEIAYEHIEKAVERMRQLKDAYPVLCGVDGAYIEHQDEEFVRNCHMYYERLYMVDDLLEAAKKDKICKLSIYDSIHTASNSFPFMEGYEQGLHMVLSGDHWVDLTNPGVSKGKAIAYIKEQENLTSDDFMAFGDFMNDYEMLEACTYSYAMANAHPKIKEVANYQAGSNEEDGVIKEICRFFQLPYPPIES